MDEEPNDRSPFDAVLTAIVTLGGVGLGGACGIVLACLYLRAQPSGGSFEKITEAFYCIGFAILLGGVFGGWFGFCVRQEWKALIRVGTVVPPGKIVDEGRCRVDSKPTGVPACGSPPTPSAQAPEEACSVRLSERDAEQVEASVDDPPAPNEAAVQAARRFLQRHG